jgi:hypothetical protein
MIWKYIRPTLEFQRHLSGPIAPRCETYNTSNTCPWPHGTTSRVVLVNYPIRTMPCRWDASQALGGLIASWPHTRHGYFTPNKEHYTIGNTLGGWPSILPQGGRAIVPPVKRGGGNTVIKKKGCMCVGGGNLAVVKATATSPSCVQRLL